VYVCISEDEKHVICGSEKEHVYVWQTHNKYVPAISPKFMRLKKNRNESYECFKGIHTYIHTHIHTYMHTYIHTHTAFIKAYSYMHTPIHAHITSRTLYIRAQYICTHTHQAHTHTHTHTHTNDLIIPVVFT